MNFTQAIKSGFRKYAEFSGRSARSEFWYWALFAILGRFCLGIVDTVLFDDFAPLEVLFGLATVIPSIAVTVRRLHDIDRVGWWWFMWFVPVVGWLVIVVFACQPGTDGPNRFGPHPLRGDAAGAMAAG